jgi:hypothetical protein
MKDVARQGNKSQIPYITYIYNVNSVALCIEGSYELYYKEITCDTAFIPNSIFLNWLQECKYRKIIHHKTGGVLRSKRRLKIKTVSLSLSLSLSIYIYIYIYIKQ